MSQRLRIEKKKEKRLVFWMLILLLPHFEPGYFDAELPVVDLLFNIGRVFSALYIIYYAIERKHSLSMIMIVFTILQGWYFINTVIQNGISKRITINTISMLIGCLIIDCYAKKYARQLIHALLIMYELLIYSNFITMLLFPKGLYATEWQWENWLLGFRNTFTFTFVPALAISMIWKHYSRRSFRFFLLLSVCVISSFLGHSATCLVTILVMTGLYLTGFYRVKIITAGNVTSVFLVSFFAVVIFRVLDYAEPFLKQLGRKTTLSGRTFIWDRTISAIGARSIIGYGQQDVELRVALVPQAYGATHAHNFVLEHLYSGGVIQLLIVIIFLVMIIANLQKYKKQEIVHCMLLGVLCIDMIFLVESGFHLMLYTFLFLCAYAKQISEQCSSQSKRRRFFI
ncbi:MAG: O-antigen ligase family protein [Flexilinea sp.]|nr:O-antigen ligase family protein [Flexilinea sp.]